MTHDATGGCSPSNPRMPSIFISPSSSAKYVCISLFSVHRGSQRRPDLQGRYCFRQSVSRSVTHSLLACALSNLAGQQSRCLDAFIITLNQASDGKRECLPIIVHIDKGTPARVVGLLHGLSKRAHAVRERGKGHPYPFVGRRRPWSGDPQREEAQCNACVCRSGP